MRIPIAVVSDIAVFGQGLAAAFRQLHYPAHRSKDVVNWVHDGDKRAVVVVAHSVADLALVSELHRRSESTVVVVLLPEAGELADECAALSAGAAGVARWDAPASEIAHIIEVGIDGRVALSLDAANSIVLHVAAAPTVELGDEERQLLMGLLAGESVCILAERIDYSQRETFRRLAALYRRLGVQNRREAIVVASRWDLPG